MSVYGVLLTASRDTAELESSTAPLRGCCEEVVVVHRSQEGDEPGDRGARRPTRLGHLVDGMQNLPAEVSVIAFVDDAGLDTADLDAVGSMLRMLGEGTAAVVRATPVTDALKRVAGEEIIGAVDRVGLFVPETPQILRRAALEDALPRAAEEDIGDPATLLVRCGLPVSLLPDGPDWTSSVAAGSDPDAVAGPSLPGE